MGLSYADDTEDGDTTSRLRLPRNEIQAYQALTESLVRQTPTPRPGSSCDGRPRPQSIAGLSLELDEACGIGIGVIAGCLMWAAIWAAFFLVIVH